MKAKSPLLSEDKLSYLAWVRTPKPFFKDFSFLPKRNEYIILLVM